MKRQIRRCTFETNSSSQHSVCIMKNGGTYTPEEILDGFYFYKDRDTGEENCVWEPWENQLQFGRSPFSAFGTFRKKWLYACASLVKDYNDEIYKELVEIALKYVPGLKKIKMPTVVDFVANKDDPNNKDNEYVQEHGKTEEELIEYLNQKEKNWGMVNNSIKYWKGRNGYFCFEKPFTGYVDENILSAFLEKENISLEEYLTNRKYIVIQDGDEYCELENFKKIGLINLDAIDHEVL